MSEIECGTAGLEEPGRLPPDLPSSPLGTPPPGSDQGLLSNELLGAFLSIMPDAAIAVDAGGRIVSANPQAEELFGYEEGSLAGAPIEALVPERARHRHRHHRAVYAEQPESRPMGGGLELVGRRRDGHEFPVDISLAPITSSEEHLVVAAVRDVSEQRAATAGLAELAAIVRSSLDAVMSTTLDGYVTTWNPAAEALFGYGRDEIVGDHIACLVPPEVSALFEELLDLASAGSQGGARDTRWRHRAGHDIDVAVSVSPVRDRSGTVLGFSAVVRDVGARKAAETELRRLLAEEERLEHEHAVTAEIRLSLLSGLPLVTSATLICERARETLGAQIVALCRTSAGESRVMAAAGLSPGGTARLPRASAGLATQVSRTGRRVHALVGTDVVSLHGDRSGARSPALGLPVSAGGAGSAALLVFRIAGGPQFDDADVVRGENLAAQAALAFELEQARLDREQVVLVSDRERIARDLHDHVIQQLFAAGMVLQSTLPLVDGAVAGPKLTDVIDALDETIRDIRDTIYDISRPFEGEPRLRAKVIGLARSAEETLGFAPGVRFEGPVDTGVPAVVVPHLLAVVREGLANAARHARASAVSVQVVLAERSVTVTLLDDGVGAGRPAQSSGLANLEERARILGGRFSVFLPAGGGTGLEWVVPVSA